MALMDLIRRRSVPADETLEDGRLLTTTTGFGMGRDEADHMAQELLDRHRRGKDRRFLRDLTAEKYMIHCDGEGSSQWADIVDGMYVMVPFSLQDQLRLQRNLLRPVVANFVAYNTGQDYRVIAEARRDKKSRDHARVDTLYGNNVIVTQRLNAVTAEALYLGASYGSCPLHVQWREDTHDPYQPFPGEEAAPGSGFADIFPGDPWATVYNDGATRNSIQSISYDKPVPTELLREIFAHVPGIDTLEGRTDLPSASRFQRTVRRWTGSGYGSGMIQGGTAAVTGSGFMGQELTALICEEVAPGVDSQYPLGRLTVIAVNNEADVGSGRGYGGGSTLLLHDGELPGARFGTIPIYSGERTDDVLGAPYVKDLDDLQVQLNHLITLRAEFLLRFARPPLLAQTDSLAEDTDITADDEVIEWAGTTPPGFLFPPAQAVSFFEAAIAETLDQFFRIAGWQAASRGESKSGDPAAKVVALQRADESVFGPINRGIQESIVEVLKTAHALAKQYMTAPMLVDLVGEEWGHIADPWIRREALSDRAPTYRMVNAFGATPEARAEQLMGLVQSMGADGQPLLTTQQFWQLWPDPSLRPPEIDARQVREARAQTVNYAIEQTVDELRQQYGDTFDQVSEQLLPRIHEMLGQEYEIERSDDPAMHIETLDQIVQNSWADPAARTLAKWRQALYYDFMQQIAMAQQPQQMGAPPSQEPPGESQMSGQERTERSSGETMNQTELGATVQQLTEAAPTG